MSRLFILTLTLVFGAMAQINRPTESSGIIKNCKRTLHMLEPDVIIYTNDITYKPDNAKNANVFFEYIVA